LSSSLDDYVAEGFAALLSRHAGLSLAATAMPFADWEQEWFLAGRRNGLFEVLDRTCPNDLQTSVLVGAPYHNLKRKPLDAHFFGVSGAKGSLFRGLAREGITEAAAIARLTYEFGHPDVLAESPRSKVDFVSYETVEGKRRALLGGEAKLFAHEHEALIAGLRHCGGRPSEEDHAQIVLERTGLKLNAKTRRNHHRKCEWIVEWRPGTFWVRSPGPSDVLGIAYERDRFVVEDLEEDGLRFEAVLARGHRSQPVL